MKVCLSCRFIARLAASKCARMQLGSTLLLFLYPHTTTQYVCMCRVLYTSTYLLLLMGPTLCVIPNCSPNRATDCCQSCACIVTCASRCIYQMERKQVKKSRNKRWDEIKSTDQFLRKVHIIIKKYGIFSDIFDKISAVYHISICMGLKSYEISLIRLRSRFPSR